MSQIYIKYSERQGSKCNGKGYGYGRCWNCLLFASKFTWQLFHDEPQKLTPWIQTPESCRTTSPGTFPNICDISARVLWHKSPSWLPHTMILCCSWGSFCKKVRNLSSSSFAPWFVKSPEWISTSAGGTDARYLSLFLSCVSEIWTTLRAVLPTTKLVNRGTVIVSTLDPSWSSLWNSTVLFDANSEPDMWLL